MKQKCITLFLCVSGCLPALPLLAQNAEDTLFSFYFNTAGYKTDVTAQKAFETFLKRVKNITAIRGYTDTVGSVHFNQKLAVRRAQQVYQLLPSHFKNNHLIVAEGETAAFQNLGQNRRVDVVGVKTGVTETALQAEKDSVKELKADQILFLPDAPVLTQTSYAYIKELAQQLQHYPTEKFEIIGHVNYQSTLPAERLKDLYQLSEARAKVVYDLLVEYGIDATRMMYKGVGNSQPIYPKPDSEDQKRANMRVQVLIHRN